LRRNRLDLLQHNESTEYTDIEAVRAEVRDARRVFVQMRWPVIDVTRRSIEETASSIMTLLARRHGVND
jgi:regulator of PEP synthase PpsR (kinase-PPPase family)